MAKRIYISIGILAGLLLIILAVVTQLDPGRFQTTKVVSEAPQKPPLPVAKKGPSSTPVPEPEQHAESSPLFSKPPRDKKEAPPPPAPNLRLAGTSVWGKSGSAIIEDLAAGTQKSYRLGDTIQGFKLTKISKTSVTLTKDGREIVLEVTKSSTPPPQNTLAWKIDDGQWGLSSEQVAEKISNIEQYVGQVAVYQHYEGAEPSGFTVHHLAEGNDIETLGIEDGDIIKGVNGLEINDMTDVLKAVYELSDAREFQVEIERNNEAKTLSYELDSDSNLLEPVLYNLFDAALGGGQ